MSTLADLLAEHTDLPGTAVAHLQRVVAEWQLLADLSFADFVLWIPLGNQSPAYRDHDFLCIAQARPTTAPTSYFDDLVGSGIGSKDHPQLRRAVSEERICREEDPQWEEGGPVRREAIPVREGTDGEIVAVLSRDTNLSAPRVPSPLEIAYLGSAGDLCQMITDGSFPTDEPATDLHTSPRVGDGFVRLDPAGAVVFASPNAASAYHRMGHAADLTGCVLSSLTRSLIADPFDAAEVAARIESALAGEAGTRVEAEARRGAAVLFRALPLRPSGNSAGALVLVRDVTEVKRRDRALLSKDATIREIHHRVKNNLQTVAALLRLQARRVSVPEAREALSESVRRVDSIAVVHEALSGSVDEQVDMEQVLDKVLPMLGELSAPETAVVTRREGKFGVVPAEVATPLVMVLAELVQNAYEHAYSPGIDGEVVVRVHRSAKWLDVEIADDGTGIPAQYLAGNDPDGTEPGANRTNERHGGGSGLGLQIVRILVESELRGSLELHNGEQAGTVAALRVPLRPPR